MAGFPEFESNEPGLTSVLVNLFENAIEEKAENISVSAECKGNDVVIKVKDDGPGIDKEKIKDIFRYKFKRRGTGLPLCKEIIEGMGGSIDIKTSGAGTTFIIRLPDVKIKEESPEEAAKLVKEGKAVAGGGTEAFKKAFMKNYKGSLDPFKKILEGTKGWVGEAGKTDEGTFSIIQMMELPLKKV